MKVSKTLGSLADHLRVGASVRNVYGEPIRLVANGDPDRSRELWLWGWHQTGRQR
jgi:hypothetical protein